MYSEKKDTKSLLTGKRAEMTDSHSTSSLIQLSVFFYNGLTYIQRTKVTMVSVFTY